MPTADAEADMNRGTAAAAPASPNQPPGERAVSALWSFGKCLGALLPVYLAGYYGFSITVILFGLMIYMGWKHSRLEKVMRLKSAMYLLENEREFTAEKVFRTKRDLPPWVNFPDVEKVEWLNKIVQQAWPFVGQYLEKLLVETIAPAIRTSSIHLQTLSFTKVNQGQELQVNSSHPDEDGFETDRVCWSPPATTEQSDDSGKHTGLTGSSNSRRYRHK